MDGSSCGFKAIRADRKPTTAVSKHYFTVMTIDGVGEVLVVGAHLKARPTSPEPCAQREAQAAVLANIIRKNAIES